MEVRSNAKAVLSRELLETVSYLAPPDVVTFVTVGYERGALRINLKGCSLVLFDGHRLLEEGTALTLPDGFAVSVSSESIRKWLEQVPAYDAEPVDIPQTVDINDDSFCSRKRIVQLRRPRREGRQQDA